VLSNLRPGFRIPWYRGAQLEGYSYHRTSGSAVHRISFMKLQEGIQLSNGKIETIELNPHHYSLINDTLGLWYSPRDAESERRDCEQTARELS